MYISIENSSVKDRESKSLIENFELNDYKFKNSLLDDPKINDALNKIQENKGEIIDFPTEIPVKKEDKNIYIKNDELKKSIPVKKGINKEFRINLNFTVNGQTQEFYSPINLERIIDNKEKDLDFFINPIYNINNPDKIYGALHFDCSNNNEDFDACYLNINKDKIEKGLFLDSLNEPLNLGEYEPNVFRRKILNNINKINKNEENKNKYIDKKYVQNNNNNINKENIKKNTYKDL